jgi:tetratricopeptide (TPR) repeat protein
MPHETNPQGEGRPLPAHSTHFLAVLLKETTRRERFFLLGLLLLSLLLRLLYLAEMAGTPFLATLRLDELYHNNWAVSIAAGNVLGDQVFFRAPLYAYWLGAVFAVFGHSYVIPRILQHLLGAFVVLMVYVLTRRFFGRKSAAVASLLVATYAPLIYIEDKFLLESLLVPELTVLILLLVNLRDSPTSVKWVAAGILFGLISITRPLLLPTGALLVALVAAWGWKAHGARKTLLWGAALLGGSFLVIAPVTIRNYVIGKEFVLIASQGGINFSIGNNPQADGFSSTLPGAAGNRWEYRDMQYQASEALGRPASPGEVDRYWLARGMEFIRTEPGKALSLMLKKLYLFWNRTEIPNNGSFYFTAGQSKLLTYLPTGFWLLGPLGLLGMLLAWRGRKEVRFVVLFVLLYIMSVLLFFVCDRFRLPVVPFLAGFAGFAAVSLWEWFRRRSFSLLMKNGALLAIFAAVMGSNLYGFTRGNPSSDLFDLGNTALAAGDYSKAVSYYTLCDRSGVILRDLFLNWGVAEWRMGDQKGALRKFQKELADFTGSYDAASNIAHIQCLMGQPESAIRYAGMARAMRPYSPSAYVELVLAMSDLGRLPEADSTLTSYLKIYGENSLYEESVLAGIHLMRGMDSLAEREYRSILSRVKINQQPDYQPEYQYSPEYRLGGSWEEFQGKVFYSMGHLFLARSAADSATAYLRAATRTLPQFSEAWIDLGIALHMANNLPDAEAAFHKGLQLNPRNSDSWFNYGLLMEAMGNRAEAERAYRTSLSLRADFAPAQEALRELLAKPS